MMMAVGVPLVIILLFLHQGIIAGFLVVAFLIWNFYISNLGYKDRQRVARMQEAAPSVPARQENFAAARGRYGSNTALIERFLQRLSLLSAEDWRTVAQQASRNLSWQDERIHGIVGPWAERNETESQRFVKDLATVTRKSLQRAHLADDEAALVMAATGSVGLGLFGKEQISATQFAGLYAPFAEVIPLESLA
jgi:hypothetical protein